MKHGTAGKNGFRFGASTLLTIISIVGAVAVIAFEVFPNSAQLSVPTPIMVIAIVSMFTAFVAPVVALLYLVFSPRGQYLLELVASGATLVAILVMLGLI